jgi:peroxiredoxin
MPNELTGDYEAAVEVSVEALNRILATLHQAGASDEASPKLLHEITARVGDTPTRPQFELAEAFLQNLISTSGDTFTYSRDVLRKVQSDLSTIQKTLVGVLRGLSAARDPSGSSELSPAVILANFPEFFLVRGFVQAQLSTLSVTFPKDTTSEVTVHCQIRALYIRDASTVALPAPIHGEIRIGFEAHYQATGNGPLLKVNVTDDDNKIFFVPAAGTSLTTSEAKQISREIRRFLRTQFEPMTVDLEEDFPFRQFKAIEAGNMKAIALPFNLSPGAHVPAFADFPGLFLAASDDFAIALSSFYIKSLLQPVLNTLEDFKKHYHVNDPVFDATLFVVYVWVTNATLQFQSSAIVLIVNANVHVESNILFVDDEDYDLTIQQKVGLTLNLLKQDFSLQAVGNLSLTGSLPTEYKNRARKDLEKIRDDALEDAQDVIQDALKSVKIEDALEPFDGAATSKYSSVEIQPAGVVLRGTFTASQRPSVVVDFAETPDGKALTAFKSWIPAGTVEKYVWTWVSQDPSQPALPWSGIEHQVSSKHRFLFKPQSIGTPPGPERPRPRAPLPWEIYQMCLRVEGTQHRATPGIANVVGGQTCQIEQPDWLAVMPSWLDTLLLVPVWGPDPGPEAIIENAITAHINVHVEARSVEDAKASSVIHFTDLRSPSPLSVMGEALLRSKHKDSSVPVVLVLPRGSFQQPRSVLAGKLGSLPRELQVALAVTEDYEGSWTRTFTPNDGSATYLVSGDGELIWKSPGPLDVASFTRAVDEHVTAGARQRLRVVRLNVRPGEPALEVNFGNAQGAVPSLSQLRGRRVLLLFWKSCSTPCLIELRRLQHLPGQTSEDGIVVVAIADGEDAQRTAEIAREHKLAFAMIPDPDRRVSRQYGVNCWPTIVSINENGLVDLVHSGITHKREVPPEHSRASAAS